MLLPLGLFGLGQPAAGEQPIKGAFDCTRLKANAAKISFMPPSAALFADPARPHLDRQARLRRPSRAVGAPAGARRSDPLSRPDRLAAAAAPCAVRARASAVGAAPDTAPAAPAGRVPTGPRQAPRLARRSSARRAGGATRAQNSTDWRRGARVAPPAPAWRRSDCRPAARPPVLYGTSRASGR